MLYRPERLEVTSTEAPFRRFNLCWRVVAVPPASCRVSVTAEIELESKMMQLIVYRILPGAVDDIVTAFEARAHCLYAGGAD